MKNESIGEEPTKIKCQNYPEQVQSQDVTYDSAFSIWINLQVLLCCNQPLTRQPVS